VLPRAAVSEGVVITNESKPHCPAVALEPPQIANAEGLLSTNHEPSVETVAIVHETLPRVALVRIEKAPGASERRIMTVDAVEFRAKGTAVEPAAASAVRCK